MSEGRSVVVWGNGDSRELEPAGPYRASAETEALRVEVQRLRERVTALEEEFEGFLPHQTDRKRCPFCCAIANGAYYGDTRIRNISDDRIVNEHVEAVRRWFRRSTPAHLVRQHSVCGAKWRERLPMFVDGAKR